MLAKLFDIQNDVLVPTEHCYTLLPLKAIMEKYSDNKQYLEVFQYIFYMTCPSADMNPFFNSPEHDREDLILSKIKVTFSTEDSEVQRGLACCKELYETPTSRAYNGIKGMLDKLAI